MIWGTILFFVMMSVAVTLMVKGAGHSQSYLTAGGTHHESE